MTQLAVKQWRPCALRLSEFEFSSCHVNYHPDIKVMMSTYSIIPALIFFVAAVAGLDGPQPRLKRPQPMQIGVYTFQGCFNALPAVVGSKSRHIFNCEGWCLGQCKSKGYAVAALHDTNCICTALFPQRTAYLEEEECNLPCPGYPLDSCGSASGAYSVYGTGLELDTQHDDDTSSIFTWDSDWTKIAEPAKLYDTASKWTESIQNFFSQCMGRRGTDGGSGGKQAGIASFMGSLEFDAPEIRVPNGLRNGSSSYVLS